MCRRAQSPWRTGVISFCLLVSYSLRISPAADQLHVPAAAPVVTLPTSEFKPQLWAYTESAPGDNWYAADFDDSAWTRAEAPFGGHGTTRWTSRDIWLRRTFTLTTATVPRAPHLLVVHDEDISVYLNGELAILRPGFTTRYVPLRLPPDLLRPGDNVLAVWCRNSRGGQVIDAGLVDMWRERPALTSSTVHVDFGSPTGKSLAKEKFCVYNCPYFTMSRWFRDLPLLDGLACRSLRYDLTWGGHNARVDMNSPQISGSAEALRYDWTDLDRFTDSLLKRGIQPMYALAYTPFPLQRTPGVWQEKPTNMEAWQKICRDYAAHFRETERPVPYYEIWNEPDNPPFFFRGSMGDYFEIYRRGALGVKEGDPDAQVGGPVVAALNDDDSWLLAFLDFVSSESLPLDFISFHNYGNPEPIIKKAMAARSRHPEFSSIPLMLTEYNSFVPLTPDFVEGGRIESHFAASRLLSDFKKLLEYPEVTRVYWAMFNDPDTPERCGLVSLDGHPKAAYNAFRLYMKMPNDRVEARSSSAEIEALASHGSNSSAALIWNNSVRDHNVQATLANTLRVGRLDCIRIDAYHGSFYDNMMTAPLTPVSVTRVTGPSVSWAGTIPAGGVVSLRLFPDAEEPDFAAPDAR